MSKRNVLVAMVVGLVIGTFGCISSPAETMYYRYFDGSQYRIMVIEEEEQTSDETDPYVSPEYLQELEYNSRANVYFGGES